MRRYSASSLAYDGHGSIVNGVNIASQQDVNEFALELILELLDLLAKGLQLSLLMVDAGVIVDLLHMVLLNSYSLKSKELRARRS